MAIAEIQKEQVRQATDIIALVGEVVALKPRGREFIGLCPFHDDKNPSMYVSPVKQIYKCFSCGASGDAFGFMMNYHKMTFPEAIRHLAERAGIEIVEDRRDSRTDSEQRTQAQRISAANDLAVSFYKAILKHDDHGRIARDYLARRGMSEAMIDAFAVGCAPDRWDGLAEMVGQKRWDVRGFEEAGLIAPRKQGGGHYDRLRHRLIFPILDALHRPVAFGGRILPDGTLDDSADAKYLNSPETAVFNKSKTLYGIHLAKKPIIDSRVAVIVEGYTDVIACHQHGAANVVATLGTALTKDHVTVLRRFADKVVLVFDADEAGQKAADRALELFLTGSMDVAIAVLPDGQDPDELFKQPDGLAKWNELVENATDALDYQFQRIRSRLDAETTMTGRQRIAEDYLRTLAEMGFGQPTIAAAQAGSIRRAMIVQRVGDLLRIGESEVDRLLKGLTSRVRSITPPPSVSINDESISSPTSPRQNGELLADEMIDEGEFGENVEGGEIVRQQTTHRMKAVQLAERQLIGTLIREPEAFSETLADGSTLDEAIQPAELASAETAALYQIIYDRLSEGATVTLAGLLGDLAEAGRQSLGDLATLAEREVEQLEQSRNRRTNDLAREAAESIVRFRNEAEYSRALSQLRDPQGATSASEKQGTSEDEEQAKLRALGHVIAHRKSNPSNARIARLGRQD